MLTEHPWFGDGSEGVWYLPVSLEGNVVVVLWLLAMLLAYHHFGKSRRFTNSAAGLGALLVVVFVLTGVPPG